MINPEYKALRALINSLKGDGSPSFYNLAPGFLQDRTGIHPMHWKSDDGDFQALHNDCLLYTSPSPRD